jgi:serine protease Do
MQPRIDRCAFGRLNVSMARFWRDGRLISAIVLGVGVWTQNCRADSASAPDSDSEIVSPADTLDLTGLQQRFEAIADKVSPSVVAISAAQVPPPVSDDDDIHRAQEMTPQKLQSILDQTTRTVGTGFIVDSDGYILTNEHVVGSAQDLWVTTSDHKVWPAVVVGSDPRSDLAVLKIPASHLPVVKFTKDYTYHRGQWTIAMGNPYGMSADGELCMSVGVISALDRSLPRLALKEDRLYSGLIQTTAQINPGNSGGPLFDIDGEVIGINTAVILPQKQTNGIGFAIPITDDLLSRVRSLEQGREVVYGYLGVTVIQPDAREREALGASPEVGVRVEGIAPDSPAADIDLRPGDLIVSFDRQSVGGTEQFVRLVGDAMVGKTVRIGLLRDGHLLTVSAVTKKRPAEIAAITSQSQRLRWRGMVLQSMSEQPGRGLVVVCMDDTCPLKKQGVHEGSIVTEVAGHSLASVTDLLAVINDVPPEQCTVQLAAPTTQPVK